MAGGRCFLFRDGLILKLTTFSSPSTTKISVFCHTFFSAGWKGGTFVVCKNARNAPWGYFLIHELLWKQVLSAPGSQLPGDSFLIRWVAPDCVLGFLWMPGGLSKIIIEIGLFFLGRDKSWRFFKHCCFDDATNNARWLKCHGFCF